MDEAGLKAFVTLALPGKSKPLGVLTIGSVRHVRFQPDEISYLVNIANLLGLTLQNVSLFEQVTNAQHQWEYTFDSIGDPILVHDLLGRILRCNQRFSQLLRREPKSVVGRSVTELLSVKDAAYKSCPYCEGVAGEGDKPDPWLAGYFLASNSTFTDPSGRQLGTVHVLKDITDRKQAESEIRRRNRELMVLNSIGQTLSESLDLSDSLHRTLRQMAELFGLDAASVYLFDKDGAHLRRIAAVGHRSDHARHSPPVSVQPELLQHVKAVHATFLSTQGLPLPPVFRETQLKEEIVASYIVVLWSKDRVIGGLVVGSRTPREFSPADVNLLIAVGSQISSAIERSILYEETRQAYENLRRTQEQLLHSEKLAAVGQLISGVAHELNNPLTAILGYSQLLTSSGQMGPQGIEYADKLYKQAQRTHRIVQNLLSFARQHKPERVPVHINQALQETLALRDYDLRMHNVRVHLDLAENLPVTSADPHQLQQVFLNMVNNAVDAILEHSIDGDLWVRTGFNGDRLCIEFTDSGPGVKDASRVFDPFYTTKPVGKGTGLGLSICYGIITEHGGTIRVNNIPTRGASFTIELPHQPVASPIFSTPGQKPTLGRDGRILLVDHDDSVLEAVGAILRGRDHQVKTAKDIREARASLEKNEFDLIIADLHLCGSSSGSDITEWLAQHRPALNQRLIWTCALAPSGGAGEKNTGNGRPILQKPFKASDLLAAVDELLLNNDQPAAIDR